MTIKDRLHRSELAVPGTNVRAMEKAPTLGADVVFLDLEDAVAPDDKEQARANVIEALRAHDWSRTAVSVRVNGLDTHWCYRDIVEVVEQAGDVLDTVLVPKVGSPSDVEFVATLLDQIEQRNGWEPRRIGIHILIETAAGMANVEAHQPRAARPAGGDGVRRGRLRRQRPRPHHEHRRREPRLRGADRPRRRGPARDPLGRSVALRHQPDGGRLPRRGPATHRRTLRRLQRRRRLSQRGPARGGDGVRGEVGDPSLADRAGERGLHAPGAEIDRARRILEAMETAAKEGKGAVSLDGRLIDAASIRMAENLMRQVEQMRGR